MPNLCTHVAVAVIIKSFRKLAQADEAPEGPKRRTGAHTPSHEDSSAASQTQSAATVAFGKRSTVSPQQVTSPIAFSQRSIASENRVLITQRPFHASHGGLWEFPGGKIEPGESAFTALKREIKEEVNLDIISAKFLSKITHAYGKKFVTLWVYSVYQFQGSAICCEDQLDLRWVCISDLFSYRFPEANWSIIEHIRRTLK